MRKKGLSYMDQTRGAPVISPSRWLDVVFPALKNDELEIKCYICGDELPSKCKQRALNQVLRTETQRKESLRRNEDRVGKQKLGHRHQESFKGGSGHLCQMLLAKKLSETCLGSMSPCGCWWSQWGQLRRSMGAEFLPTAVHSTG